VLVSVTMAVPLQAASANIVAHNGAASSLALARRNVKREPERTSFIDWIDSFDPVLFSDSRRI
jgi:hypothetical protein